MFHIVFPFPDSRVYHLMLGGKDLAEAFDEYRRYHYLQSIPGSLAVWHNGALVARIVHVLDKDGELEPLLQEWN